MNDLLTAIVAATRTRVHSRYQHASPAVLEHAAAARQPRGAAFVDALTQHGRCNVIAECKRRSPAKGVLRADYDPVAIARAYAQAGAAAVSVLTEPAFFDGSLAHLTAVREAVDIPVLRKDFIVFSAQLLEARAAGADAVLLIAACLSDADLTRLLSEAHALDLAVVVEIHALDELTRALDAGARIVGVNNRNLRTLDVDTQVSAAVAARIPRDVLAISESGLRTAADLRSLSALGYRAFLIGERLMTSPSPGRALAELLGGAS